jgi:bacillithiol system protein YtxJ
MMHVIASEADVAALLAAPLAVLYKHSPICGTSSFAYEEMVAFRRVRPVPVYLVDVIKHRPLSRALAERLAVLHQSPQAIVLRHGVAAWHRSHYEIEVAALARAVDQYGGADEHPAEAVEGR